MTPIAPTSDLCAAQAHLALARASGQPQQVVAALQSLACRWAANGAAPTAEAHLEEALRWSALLGGADMSIVLHCEAAELALCGAEHDAALGDRAAARLARHRALEHAFAAALLAERTACAAWEAVALLRISDVFDRCGRRDEACELQLRAVRILVHAGAAMG